MNIQTFASMGVIFGAYILTFGLTCFARSYLTKRALLDHPNERSSHTVPVPRGGGWAPIAVLIVGMAITAFIQGTLEVHMTIILSTLMLAIISWRDDHKGASIGMRLSVHILAACFGSLAFADNQMIFGGALPFWLDRSLMILAWAWFINLTNFMDGIDGITSVESISIATGVCIIFGAANILDPFADSLTLVMTGACLGFLALNWYPARIFLGDVGSVSLGYLLGFLLLSLAVKGQWAAALILPAYYLADSGLVLVTRAAQKKKVWQAHREHFYQRAAEAMGRHDKVVWWIIFANIGLVVAALISVSQPFAGLALGAVIVAILLWKMHKAQA